MVKGKEEQATSAEDMVRARLKLAAKVGGRNPVGAGQLIVSAQETAQREGIPAERVDELAKEVGLK